jgi:hypothetical protein
LANFQLHDELTGEDSSCEAEVDRHHEEGGSDWVLALQDTVLGDGEDNGTENSSKSRSDGPGSENLGNTLPAPGDVVCSNCRDTHADNTTHDGVGGGNRHTKTGSNGQVNRGSDKGTGHSDHENRRVLLEEGDVHNLGANGIGNTTSNTDSTCEFHDCGQAHSLPQGHRPRRDRRSPRVGDIVGSYHRTLVSLWRENSRPGHGAGQHTDHEGIEEAKDHRNSEDIVELVKHGGGWAVYSFYEKRSL